MNRIKREQMVDTIIKRLTERGDNNSLLAAGVIGQYRAQVTDLCAKNEVLVRAARDYLRERDYLRAEVEALRAELAGYTERELEGPDGTEG